MTARVVSPSAHQEVVLEGTPRFAFRSRKGLPLPVILQFPNGAVVEIDADTWRAIEDWFVGNYCDDCDSDHGARAEDLVSMATECLGEGGLVIKEQE